MAFVKLEALRLTRPDVLLSGAERPCRERPEGRGIEARSMSVPPARGGREALRLPLSDELASPGAENLRRMDASADRA